MCAKQTCHWLLHVVVFSILFVCTQTVKLLRRAFPRLLERGTIGGPIRLITKAVPPGSGGEKTTYTINQHTQAETRTRHATPPSGEDAVHPGIQLDPLLPSASEGVVVIEFALNGEDLIWDLEFVHSPRFAQLMHDHQTAKVC